MPLIHVFVLEERSAHITTLLDLNGDVDASCKCTQTTALMRATHTQNAHIVDLLLRRNADLNALDHKGYTAFHHALQNDSVSCLQLMLSHAPRLKIPVFEQNVSILHLQNEKNEASFAHVTRRYADTWMPMLQDKIDAFKDTIGGSVFHLDVLDLIETWVLHNPLIDRQNHMQKTPLITAIDLGLCGHVDALLRAGANTQIGCVPPLHCALQCYHAALKSERCEQFVAYRKIVKLLLKANADTSAEDTSGCTALEYAVECGLVYMTRILARHQKRVQCPSLTSERVDSLLQTTMRHSWYDMHRFLSETLDRG
jgi:ankyrin repeat protein